MTYRRTPAVLVTAATPPTGDRLRAAAPAPVTASQGPNRCRPRALNARLVGSGAGAVT